MSKKILAINSGSSSIKFKLYLMPEEKLLVSGSAEDIGGRNGEIKYSVGDVKESRKLVLKDHDEAISHIIDILTTSGVIKDQNDIAGVGHRISHGGSYYTQSVEVDEDVKDKIDKLKILSPLHNPNGLAGIEAFEKFLPNAKEVVTFDTSFHSTIPEKASVYALPYEYYRDYKIKRYGFHGPSHQYVSQKAREVFGKEHSRRMITCHLGNGCSITAIKDGKSINTSMGFTPLAGTMMGTRTGDIDPEIVPFLEEKFNLSSDEVRQLMNKKSGLAGISGISNDEREVEQAAREGNERAKLALDIFVHSIQQFIGAYTTDLEGLDTLVFTAGIGEHAALVRKEVCSAFGYLGVKIDDEKNNHNELVISTPDSKVNVAVIPTNEEIIIARDVMRVAKLN
ncbi:acetate/propionate family kinase [Lactobacillus sp. 3B(2020)]|uniref:acetate/propionate family kinase n=1 Tax=Lactobacillus sp. 3B(2020) TaxID=2695882 RepID=UPI0015DFE7A3|nr:acetate kinase [Lactobacillus sp. 3B(2020)]QLL69158.1 acetate/propionate family kinase [Lactobacillus sp. 3B(2020)]